MMTATHNGRVTTPPAAKAAAKPQRKKVVRLLRATVQFSFVIDGGGDDLDERQVQPVTFTPREWAKFMAGGYRQMVAKFQAEIEGSL